MISRHTELYLNLTNGLEFLQPLVKQCEEEDRAVPFKVVRIPSTWLEQHRYDQLMATLNDDLLLHLALGDTCIIFDCGSRNKERLAELGNPSRAQWFGVPLIKYILDRVWFDLKPETVHVKKTNTIKEFKKIYDEGLSETTITRLKYFKKFVPETTTEVHLEYKSKLSEHDGDYGWYVEVAQSTL